MWRSGKLETKAADATCLLINVRDVLVANYLPALSRCIVALEFTIGTHGTAVSRWA